MRFAILISIIVITMTLQITTCSNSDDDNDDIAPITISFAKSFGGRAFDDSQYLEKTSDDGYIIIANTYSYGHGDCDIWLLKTDKNGVEICSQYYGGEKEDYAFSLCQTSDKGFIIAGTTESFGSGEEDIWVIKTDNNGNLIWSNTYGSDKIDFSYSIKELNNGGYIVGGTTYSVETNSNSILLIRLNEQGVALWTKTYSFMYFNVLYDLDVTSDGGFIICGVMRDSTTDPMALIIKTDDKGSVIWYNDLNKDFLSSYSIKQVSDGGFIVLGNIRYHENIFLKKIDENGNLLWSKEFGGHDKEWANEVIQTSDNGYIFCGYSSSFSDKPNIYVVKTDNVGNEIYSFNYGGDEWDSSESIKQINENDYVLCGWTNSYGAGDSDAWLIEFEEIE